MQILDNAQETAVMVKARELCDAIVSEDSFKRMKGQIEAFMADEKVQALYQGLGAKQGMLQQKQQTGAALTDEEIADFEKDRDELLANEVATGFMEAQQGMQDLQENINMHVSMTFELGRAPTQKEIEDELHMKGSSGGGGCCGGGGCGSGGGGCG
jgi:cell fate (sporulation/competence/biofilm development) regulator YlbF (YheA/YmcA/DUF963 family)